MLAYTNRYCTLYWREFQEQRRLPRSAYVRSRGKTTVLPQKCAYAEPMLPQAVYVAPSDTKQALSRSCDHELSHGVPWCAQPFAAQRFRRIHRPRTRKQETEYCIPPVTLFILDCESILELLPAKRASYDRNPPPIPLAKNLVKNGRQRQASGRTVAEANMALFPFPLPSCSVASSPGKS